MRPTLRAVAAIGLSAALFLAACGDDSEEVNAAAGGGGDASALEGTSWLLDLDTLDVGSTGGAMATLLLQDGQASGTNGCNQFSGAYELDGSNLSFDALATTQMACTAELDAAGAKVTEGLEATESYSISGSTLTLEGADGPVLTYEAASAGSLVGDWEIVGYLDESRQAFSSTLAGDPPTSITFADDGTVSGFAGCNTFSGSYTAEGSTITFGPLLNTFKACEPAEVMEQEAALLVALQSATTWQTTAMGADFFRADGTRVISVAPAS